MLKCEVKLVSAGGEATEERWFRQASAICLGVVDCVSVRSVWALCDHS